MASSTPTFSELRRQLAARTSLAPVYLLYGEEGYYIDELVKDFENLIPEEERDFNLYVLYGPESGVETVMDVCHRYPMMSERQVVIVKEAQELRADQFSKLRNYIEHPNPTTVLVVSCRGTKEVKGKNMLAEFKKHGVVFESKRLKDYNVGPVIHDLIKSKGLNVDPKALAMLRDYIGADLAKIYNEIDKLTLTLGKGAMVTPEAVERNIGISKDYNNFELNDAIIERNAAKAFRIIEYLRVHTKGNQPQGTAATIFDLFSNLLIYHYTRDKSQSGYMDALGFRDAWRLKPYQTAARNYNVRQTIEIISAIREFDARSKGVGSRQNGFDLLKDLVFHILTARGVI